MSGQLWDHSGLPSLGRGAAVLLQTEVSRVADLTTSRAHLASELTKGARGTTPQEEDLERLLLAYEELASNGLRHAGPPVEVTVNAGASGWLIVVSDTATERPPSPAVDRDPALGGLGLHLVAALSRSPGWTVMNGRKLVWACVTSGNAA